MGTCCPPAPAAPLSPEATGAPFHSVALDRALEPPVLDSAHVAGISRGLPCFEHLAAFGLVRLLGVPMLVKRSFTRSLCLSCTCRGANFPVFGLVFAPSSLRFAFSVPVASFAPPAARASSCALTSSFLTSNSRWDHTSDRAFMPASYSDSSMLCRFSAAQPAIAPAIALAQAGFASLASISCPASSTKIACRSCGTALDARSSCIVFSCCSITSFMSPIYWRIFSMSACTLLSFGDPLALELPPTDTTSGGFFSGVPFPAITWACCAVM